MQDFHPTLKKSINFFFLFESALSGSAHFKVRNGSTDALHPKKIKDRLSTGKKQFELCVLLNPPKICPKKYVKLVKLSITTTMYKLKTIYKFFM